MPDFRSRLIRGILLLILVQGLFSLEWRIDPTPASALLPEGWVIYDRSETGRISFINPDKTVIFQITVYPGESSGSDREMMESHMQGLDVLESDVSRYLYQDRTVSFSDSLFRTGEGVNRGWFLFIDREDYDYYLTCFTREGMYEEYLPWIVSCMDSFSPDDAGRKSPGALSTLYSFGNGENRSVPFSLEGEELNFKYKAVREETAQLLIEREAAILSSYKDPDEFAAAWKRYYQMIYRDTSKDLDQPARAIETLLGGKSDVEKAEILLSWLQDYEYGSSNSFSDLLAPISVIVKRTGDCDALGMVYCHFLDKMGIPSLLMVSHVYSHAMAAVYLNREGAGFEYGNRKFIVAEMTKKIDIGMISRDMADINKWIVIAPGEPDSRTVSIVE